MVASFGAPAFIDDLDPGPLAEWSAKPDGAPAKVGDEDVLTDRGLLFISYQRSIRRQFELLTQDWMNSPISPEGNTGHDVLVGQARLGGNGRTGSFARQPAGPIRKISTNKDWIEPTGGRYFFAPSRQAINIFLADDTQGRKQWTG